MKKQTLTLLTICLMAVFSAQAQNGLQQILVEKFYVANATDAAQANTAASNAGYQTGTLPSGAITWRIYADLEPGWGVQSVYGVNGHPLQLSTSTNFYNHPSGNSTGGPLPSSSSSILAANTTILDSYISCGAVASNRFGVIKTEDNSAATPTGGGANLNFTPAGVLANTDASIGLPLTTADGMYNTVNNPALLALTLLGDISNAASVALFTDGSSVGSAFNSSNCSWGVLGEQVGAFPTGTNRVLIGQFTTNGVFTYKLNLQLRNTTTFAVRNFVYSNPVGSELLFPTLSGVVNQNCTNTSSSTAVTACGSYVWNGTTYTTSGTYTYTTTNAAGCDSIASLSLTITTPPTWFQDSDGDGFGKSNVSLASCTQPAGYVFDNSDCNDNNGAVNPNAVETCNGIDDDCDGDIDSDDQNVTGQPLWYADVDGDGLGDASDTLRNCLQPAGFVSNQNDCNDANSSIGAATVYFADVDQDNYGNPQASQSSCTGAPAGFVAQAGDCNDNNAAVNPAATEVCNGIDDNCDQQIDNGVATISAPASISGTATACVSATSGTVTFSCATVPGAASYAWTVPAGFSITAGQGTTSISVSYTGTAVQAGISGQVCVSASSSCNTSASTCVQVDYQVAAPTTPGSISGPSKLCPTNTGVYSVTPVARATNYTWSVPAGVSIVSGQGTASINVSVSASYTGGTISLTASNVCGTSPARTKAIALNLPITPSAITGRKDGVCNTNAVTYTISPVANATSYTWTVSGGTIVSGQGTTTISVNFSTFTSGSVTVRSVNGCGNSSIRSLSVTGTPARPGEITGSSAPCANTTVPYAVATVNGASLYTWSTTANGAVATGQGTKNVTVSWGSAASNQAVRVTASNSCGSSTTRALTGITVSSCLREQLSMGTELMAWPNPASDVLNLSFEAPGQDYRINMIDATGRVVWSQEGKPVTGINTLEVPVSSYASGMYIVLVESGSARGVTRISIR